MEQLNEFWALVVDVWRDGVFGIDIGRVLVAIAILVAFLGFRRLLARVVFARLTKWAKRTRTELDEKVIDALQEPIQLVPAIFGVFLAAEYLELTGKPEIFAENLVRTLILLAIFWGLYNAIAPLSFLAKRLERLLTRPMIDWLVKAIKVGVVLIGAAAILEVWGFQVGPILAGLGLLGVAVALGAQDLFKNLIAGILVIAEKRFGPGDWIKVDGVVEGVVEKIGFRSTFVRRFDKAPVFVPNAHLSDNAVTNFSAMTYRRIYWMIGVEYRTSVDQLRAIRDQIEQYVVENEDFAGREQVSTFVRVDRFSDSSIDLMLYCFTKTTNWGEWLRIKEDLAYRIKDIVEGAGSGFAFPSQSLYVESLPTGTPDRFVPPA